MRHFCASCSCGKRCGERGFHNFYSRRRRIVFRTKRDHRTAAMKDVPYQLKRCGPHAARLIDAQRNVKNSLAAMDRLGNHQLFVLAPFGAGRDYR